MSLVLLVGTALVLPIQSPGGGARTAASPAQRAAVAPLPPASSVESASPSRRVQGHGSISFHGHHSHRRHGLGAFFDLAFPCDRSFEAFSSVEFFGPATAAPWWGGFGWTYSPVGVVWPPLFFDPNPPLAMLPPRGMLPAAPGAGRAASAEVAIPQRFVEPILPARRPTLAQRAEAAKLEGNADRVFSAGHFARAVDYYRQALNKASDRDEVKFKLGAALIATAQYDQAGQMLREALHRRPDWPHVDHDLRKLFPDDAAIDRTLQALERESHRAGADPDVPWLRGYMLYFSGQRGEAATVFRAVPPGDNVDHFRVFTEAIERQRDGK